MLIQLTQGKYAAVDDDDYEVLVKHRWWAVRMTNGGWYAVCKIAGKRVWMHRYLIGAEGQTEVDHRNMNGLDNRRQNLRLATRTENQANKKLQRNNTSGIRGVRLDLESGKWRSMIHANGRRFHLGYFTTREEAARVYSEKSLELFGEFAYIAPNNGEPIP